jgi:hypothetical protein
MFETNDDFKKIKNINSEIFSSLGFFSSGQNMSFIFKKTEKISQGLFLATNHIKDNEHIKWLIRQKAVDIVCISAQMNNLKVVNMDTIIDGYLSNTFDLVSLLNIASGSNIMSHNNSLILIDEINGVLKYILDNKNNDIRHTQSIVLSSDFFKVEDVYKSGLKPSLKNNSLSSFDKINSNKNNVLSNRNDQNKPYLNINIKDKKNTRQEQIINLLKTQSGLTIKDFLGVIKDCSAKTIQRELIDLTRLGLIIKEGERRWSKYSIKN